MRREEEDDQREYDVVVCKEFEMCAFKAMYECGRWFVRKRERMNINCRKCFQREAREHRWIEFGDHDDTTNKTMRCIVTTSNHEPALRRRNLTQLLY